MKFATPPITPSTRFVTCLSSTSSRKSSIQFESTRIWAMPANAKTNTPAETMRIGRRQRIAVAATICSRGRRLRFSSVRSTRAIWRCVGRAGPNERNDMSRVTESTNAASTPNAL